MKYVKTLGLLAVAAAAMMAFAGVASATIVTSPAGTTYTGKIHASAGVTTLHGAATITCQTSTVEGELKEHTGTGATTARGPITDLTFNNCGEDVVEVVSGGTLEVHKHTPTGDGIVTSSGAKVTITPKILFPAHCTYTTNNTQIGTLTGSSSTKGKAVLHIHGTIPRTEGSFFCGANGTWTGTYTVNTPAFLDVH